jgi:hypothetical protein
LPEARFPAITERRPPHLSIRKSSENPQKILRKSSENPQKILKRFSRIIPAQRKPPSSEPETRDSKCEARILNVETSKAETLQAAIGVGAVPI